MNTPRRLTVLVIALAAVFVTTTAFQCGSAEMTTAKLAIQQNQLPKAEESLLRELQKNDKNEEAWFLLGEVRYKQKNFKGMNEAFTSALKVSDTHKAEIGRYRMDVWAQSYNKGIEYYNKGRDTVSYFPRAIEQFDMAVAVNPDSANTYFVRALAKYNSKDITGAEADLEKALSLNPGGADAARLRGNIAAEEAEKKMAAGDTTGARALYARSAAAYEIAYRIDPNNTSNIGLLLDAYDKAGLNERALALTRDAVAKDPMNFSNRFNYGVFLLRQSDFKESITQFEKALEIKPGDPDATYNLGVSHLNWGVAQKNEAEKKAAAKGKDAKIDDSYKEEFRRALPYLEQSAKIRKDDLLLHQQLGRIYANLNMPKEAKAAFDEVDRISKMK